MEDENTDTDRRRRTFLKALGTTSAFAATAGCIQGDDSDDTPTSSPSEGTTPTSDAATPTPESTKAAGTGSCKLASPACDEPEVLAEGVTEDTTIGTDCDYWRVTASRLVVSATLTVEPGTHVEFGPGAALRIANGGALNAVGTCEEPIAFTGETEDRGLWDGISFVESNTADNRLHYVVVENAGADDALYLDTPGGVSLMDGSRVSIEHSTFRNNEGYGLQHTRESTLSSFTENVLTGNSAGAVTTNQNVAHELSADSDYTGNDRDRIYVWEYLSSDGISGGMDVTWQDLGVPYVLDGMDVYGTLTIEPGTTIRFREDGSIMVEGDGTLVAEGTEDSPIEFVGADETRGYWRGLHFRDSRNSANALHHVGIRHAGSQEVGYSNERAGIAAEKGSTVSIENTSVEEVQGYGVAVHETAELTSFANNTLTNNAAGAVVTNADRVHMFTPDNDYTGNDTDRIRVYHDYANEGLPADMDVTWQDLGVPYDANEIWIYGTLTIDPGVTIHLRQDAELQVGRGRGGKLVADGTGDDPITITSTEPVPGYNAGISFDDSKAANSLSHLTLEYAGQQARALLDPAGISVINGSNVALESVTVRHVDGWGLLVDEDSTVSTSNVTYEDTTEGDEKST